MAVKGVFASDQGIVGERRGDFASSVLKNNPQGTAPLFALSAGMESAPAADVVITWFEELHNTGRIGVTNNASTGTSLTVSVADMTNILAGQLYLAESSGEVFFVTAASGTTVTVVRAFGGTTLTAWDGSSTTKYMQLIGTAFEEASSRPTAIANLGFPVFNYTQIFRNAWNISGTAKAVAWYTGNKTAKNKRDCANFHAEAIERSMIWGVRALGQQNGEPFRTAAGLLSFIATNVQSESTSVKWSDLRSFLETIFRWNVEGKPNERIAFCGNQVLLVLETLAINWSQIKLDIDETEFGFRITKMTTPFGQISLMTHPLMVENPTFAKNLYVFHPGAIRTRWLRPTWDENVDVTGVRAGVDADYGTINSELSFELKAERTAGIFTGIDTANTTTI